MAPSRGVARSSPGPLLKQRVGALDFSTSYFIAKPRRSALIPAEPGGSARGRRGLEEGAVAVTRTHFAFRIDLWDGNGENVVEHLAGVEDYTLALATYRAAVERWPGGAITLRQGARVIEDSRRIQTASQWPYQGWQGEG